ncbi:MAG TPA: GvpL/GvpF family gas vesicle protein [Solirubrobacterales bacterium]
MASDGVPQYVYGVVPADGRGRARAPGIGGEGVRVIRAGRVGALASPVPDADGELPAGREELRAHAQVLEAALAEFAAVLPMRFGIVMPSDAAVRDELLGPHSAQLEAQLDELAGKFEMGLKALYDEDAILREIVTENREARALRAAIAAAPADATYPQRIRLGELIAAGLDERRLVDERAIAERLERFAIAVDLRPPIHERMALNAAFLLDRERLGRFDEELELLAAESHPRIGFRLTGPLPPHSFVELSVER